MNRRLRKKLHVGEFQHFAFCVKIFTHAMSAERFDSFLDEFLLWLESKTLEGGGPCGPTNPQSHDGCYVIDLLVTGFLQQRKRTPRGIYIGKRSCTEEDRDAVLTWVQRPEVDLYEVTKLKVL